MNDTDNFDGFVRKSAFSDSGSRDCISDGGMYAFVYKKMNKQERQAVREHLAHCEECFQKMRFFRDVKFREEELGLLPKRTDAPDRFVPRHNLLKNFSKKIFRIRPKTAIGFAFALLLFTTISLYFWSYLASNLQKKPLYTIIYIDGEIRASRDKDTQVVFIGMQLFEGDILEASQGSSLLLISVDSLIESPIFQIKLDKEKSVVIKKDKLQQNFAGTIPTFEIKPENMLAEHYTELPNLDERNTRQKNAIYLITPLEETYSTRPVFEWENDSEKKLMYRLVLRDSNGNLFLDSTTTEQLFGFPLEKSELLRGNIYHGELFVAENTSVLDTMTFSFHISENDFAQTVDSVVTSIETKNIDAAAKQFLKGSYFFSENLMNDALWTFANLARRDSANTYYQIMVKYLRALQKRGGV